MKLISSLAFTAMALSAAIGQQQPASQTLPQAQPAQQPVATPAAGDEQAVAQPADAQAAQQAQAQAQGNYISLRVVGSWVRDARGLSLGRIEEVLLNRNNGALEFAIVAPNSTTASTRLVPIPWSMLNYAWDQAKTGGPAGANQVFVANVDAQRLAQAPSMDRSRSTTANDPTLAAASTFFSGQGATGTGSSSVSGAGISTTGVSNQAPAAVLTTDGVIADTNSLAVVTTNAGGTNAVPPALRRQTNVISIPRPGSAPPYTPLTTNQTTVSGGTAATNPSQPTTGANTGGTAPPGGNRVSGTPVPGTGRPPAQPGNGNSGSGTRVPATGGTGSGTSSGGSGSGGTSGGTGGSTGGSTGGAGGAAGGAGGTR